MTCINVGIIGTGKHGTRYATHIINDMPNMCLKAISRRSPVGREQADQWHCTYYSVWQELVADSHIDAVISVVPPSLNRQIAEACCRHGKALLMEKPLATTVYDAQAIVSMCNKTNTPLTVAQTLRYNTVIQGLRHHFPRLGTCYSFVINQRIEPSTLAWLQDPKQAGAGVILHTAVHLFDALRFITGLEIRRVRATSRMIHNPRIEDIVLAEVECDQGVMGLLDTSKISPARTGGFEFMGQNGILSGDQIHGSLQWLHGTELTPLPCAAPGPTIVNLLEDWYNFLCNRGENPIDGLEGLSAVRACKACLRSAKSGTWEQVM